MCRLAGDASEPALDFKHPTQSLKKFSYSVTKGKLFCESKQCMAVQFISSLGTVARALAPTSHRMYDWRSTPQWIQLMPRGPVGTMQASWWMPLGTVISCQCLKSFGAFMTLPLSVSRALSCSPIRIAVLNSRERRWYSGSALVLRFCVGTQVLGSL